MIVQFIGLGYIGLPTAAVVAQHGIQVHGVDVNQKVVEIINKGEIHIVEPGLEAVVKEGELADVVVFLVAHKEFRTLNFRNDKIILDFAGIFRK